MSYDISIWSVKPIDLHASLPEDIEWGAGATCATHSEDDWQIVINTSSKLQIEDVPVEASILLPGIEYLTQINLEPIHAPGSARKLLVTTARHLATALQGVIENPQDDTFKTPVGMKRYTPPSREKHPRFSIVTMTWWFTDSPVLEDGGLIPIFQYFKTNLPEGIPRRYGTIEPPEFIFEETGEEHFYEFIEGMKSNPNLPVLTTKSPVTEITFNVRKDCGFRQTQGEYRFAANTFTISFDSSVLGQPGWDSHLRRVFLDVSVLLQPFYGDVRILHNYIFARGTHWIDGETEHHPISSLWFNGIPKRLGQAIVVGDPYFNLWKKARKKGDVMEELSFIQTDNWKEEKDVTSIIGKTPRKIAQIEEHGGVFNQNEQYWKYPRLFPFSEEVGEE